MADDDDEMPGLPLYNAPTDDDDAMNESDPEASDSHGINGVGGAT